MNSLLAEIHNIAMFFETILLVGVYTGSIVVVAVTLGYELATKRRA